MEFKRVQIFKTYIVDAFKICLSQCILRSYQLQRCDTESIHENAFFNMNHSGSSFERIFGCNLLKGISNKMFQAELKCTQNKSNLAHCTVMHVVYSEWDTCKAFIVFPGKQENYCRMKIRIFLTLH